ncbi:MAG: hypothetical protein NWE83_06590 [Candidatus Bathyarchaeota archaeon]|nr:hypothetical protein [Candidatus Bathyarchaeota archaeon]
MTSWHSLTKRIQQLEHRSNPEPALFYNKIRVDFVYPPTGQRWHRVCFTWSRKQHTTCYEFEVSAEEVAELEYPDTLYPQDFMQRWMERHPDAFNVE